MYFPLLLAQRCCPALACATFPSPQFFVIVVIIIALQLFALVICCVAVGGGCCLFLQMAE